SSAARIRVGSATRAVSVAEVIAPSEDGDVARDLMVALVRTGVTATCSAAEHTRYGHLEVDSNLPDARISLGGPDVNAFTAAVLAAADPAYAAELDRQLAATGTARIFVPATSSLAAVWIPDADLRGVLVLPVLIVAGNGAVDAVVADLDNAEIVVEQDVVVDCGEFESHTVALINRGVPGFAVERDGTLHTSLMRSCTGWPSGVWIDPPQRKAPDGSNFQLQHWSHSFDFALVTGSGDWRAVEMPSRSAEFNHSLIAVTVDQAGGELPADGSLLSIEPERTVQLGALKARGNPTATGSSAEVDPTAVTIRLVETTGAPTDIAISSPMGTLSELRSADLLEDARLADDPPLHLHGYQIATVAARFEATPLIDGERVPLAPDAEAAQPLYARYWLHNRGPAPLGGLPAVAHLHPEALTVAPGETVHLRVTVASDCSDATLIGTVRLRYPRGWDPSGEVPFDLPARGHREYEIAVTVPHDAAPGHYPVRAQLTLAGDVPPAWRQTVEDVCVVTVAAELALETPPDELVRLMTEPTDVVVNRGERARIAVTVGTDARADLAVEAHLISP
ncbi:MAG: NEW3 domain-containing protein, partial [Mycobacterium sp.]